MTLVDWASAEPYDTAADLAKKTEWTHRAQNTTTGNTLRPIFGFPGEKWFNMGSTTQYSSIRRPFLAPNNEGEFSASINIDEGASLNQLPELSEQFTFMGIRRDDDDGASAWKTAPGFPGVHLTRRSQIEGNKVYLTVRGVAAVFEGIIPDFELTAGGLYYFTLRWRDSTGAGNDGVVEVWCNNVLLWSDATIDFAGVDLSAQSVILGAIESNASYARNLTIHDEWTTDVGVAPKHKNVYEITDFNVIATPNYTLEGPAGTINEALTDDLIASLITTITPNSLAEFGIDQIPAVFAANNVVDVGTRIQAAREANGYATPIVSITDDVGTIFGTKTEDILAVGDARTVITTVASVTSPLTLDKVRINIDSGS